MKNPFRTTKKSTGAKKSLIGRTLGGAAFLASALAFAATIWIVLPAPAYTLWLWSVAASEWSFAFGALAFVGIFAAFLFGRGKIKIASLIFGASALLISLYPFFSALSAARKHDVSLSARQYAFGFLDNQNAPAKETFTFATVDGKALELDVYAPPENVSKNGASVIVIHGGAWKAGARSDFPQWNQWLARHGFTVFDVDYRLAPQPNYLSATGDVKCAVRWVKKNAARFDISPDKIALLGRSAGAHLALLAAYTANDARLPPSGAGEGKDENSPRADETIRAVVSFYAPTDLLWGFENPANQSVIDGPQTLADFLGGSPREAEEIRERFALASPVSHVETARTPPTLLVHGGRDQLVRSENSSFLERRLKEASVPHKIVFLSYAQHGFDYNFNGWGAQIVQPILLDFLRANVVSNER